MYQNQFCNLSFLVSLCSLMTLSARICFPLAVRLAAFASWFFLFPPGTCAFLTVDLLPLLADPVGVTASHIAEVRVGWVPSLLREDLVSSSTGLRAVDLSGRADRSCHLLPTSSSLLSTFPMTRYNAASSRVHLRSPVHPSPSPVQPGG